MVYLLFIQKKKKKIHGERREELNDGEMQFEIKLFYSLLHIYHLLSS